MKYSIPFKDDEERARIRKWAGVTRGASILKRDDDWTVLSTASGTFTNGFTVIQSYIVEVKTKKAEMLLKLQFGEAKKYFEQSSDYFGDDDGDLWYDFK
jgi:hypothetical protein